MHGSPCQLQLTMFLFILYISYKVNEQKLQIKGMIAMGKNENGWKDLRGHQRKKKLTHKKTTKPRCFRPYWDRCEYDI